MKSSEAIPLYIVRFMRLDDYPDEEYNYIRKSDADKHIPVLYHLNYFHNSKNYFKNLIIETIPPFSTHPNTVPSPYTHSMYLYQHH